MGYPVPLTTDDWARVRYEYECTNCKVVEICAEHGISAGTLRDRVRRWGWKRRWSGPLPREGPPLMAVPMIAFAAPESSPAEASAKGGDEKGDPAPHIVEDGRERPFVVEDGRERPFVIEDGRERPLVHDARPIGERLQGAIAQVMPALETTLSSLAAGPMQPRQMEQAARALGSLTRTLRELYGLVAEHGAQRCDDDPIEDVDELRASLNRQIDALIAEEREERPRRYLAAWEEFAAEAAKELVPAASSSNPHAPRPAYAKASAGEPAGVRRSLGEGGKRGIQ